MSAEPDFLSQTEVLAGSREQIEWMSARLKEAKAKGARWHRWTHHPDNPNLLLHEAWHVRPVDADGDLDEGSPRFQMIALPS